MSDIFRNVKGTLWILWRRLTQRRPDNAVQFSTDITLASRHCQYVLMVDLALLQVLGSNAANITISNLASTLASRVGMCAMCKVIPVTWSGGVMTETGGWEGELAPFLPHSETIHIAWVKRNFHPLKPLVCFTINSEYTVCSWCPYICLLLMMLAVTQASNCWTIVTNDLKNTFVRFSNNFCWCFFLYLLALQNNNK
jgi:hypothetical protein